MRRSSWLCLLLGVLLSLSLLAGCSKSGADSGQAAAPAQETVTQTGNETEETELVEIPETEPGETQETETEQIQGSEPEEIQASEAEEPQAQKPQEPQESQAPETEESLQEIDEDGSYTTKEDVALYIHIYGKLPSNFITKKQAEKLGWNGGSLEPYAPGKCIGGGYFGNYEGILPDGNYKECDIDTLGKKKRGAKRLIYSDDGRIYYTDDHYESFTQLY